jgi:hypothetical protein
MHLAFHAVALETPADKGMHLSICLNSMSPLRKITMFSLLAFSLAVTPAQIATGPVGWWKGEGNAVDAAGTNSGTDTVASPVSFAAGKNGQGLSLSGGSIQVPDAAALKPTHITVQAWVKATSPGNYTYIVGKARGVEGISYALYTGAGGGLIFFVNSTPEGGAVRTVLSPSADPAAIWDGQWHQATGVYDGQAARLYVDGVEIGSADGPGAIDYSSPQPLLFGTYRTAGGLFFNGSVDEIKIFDHALTPEDIAGTFSDPNHSANTAGLIAWWKFENNFLDSVGAFAGSSSITPRIVYYPPGKVGQAFFPDGGIIQIPDSPAVQPSVLTIQAWVRSVAPGAYRYIVGKARGTGGTVSYALYTGDSAGLRFFVNLSGTGVIVTPAASIEQVWDGAWHHVTGVYDGATVKLYIDGLLIGSADAAGDIDYSEAGPLIFGDYRVATELPFRGGIDEVKLYDRALSEQEIVQSFTGNTLVSWWRAEGNADDVIGSNEGSASANVRFVQARTIGSAFGTAGGVVQVPDSDTLRPSIVTIEALFSGAAPGPNKYLVSKSRTSAGASYALLTTSTGALAFAVTADGGTVVTSPAADLSIWDGNFHAVAGTYDGQRVRLYIDGQEVGSGTPATGPIQYGTTHSAGKLLIGDFSDTPSAANFNGSIDEIKIYNTALSAQDIRNNVFQSFLFIAQPQSQSAAQGSTVTLTTKVQGPLPLNYQWRHNGVDVPGGTNATLVLTNAQQANAGEYSVLVSKGTLRYTDGVSGRAFQAGSGGFVRVPNNPAFETENFTVQCWVRATAPGAYKWILAKARHPSFHSASYGIYSGGTGGIFFFVVLAPPEGNPDGFAFVPVSAGPELWDGKWHQITGTWDGQFVTLYLDGQLVQTVDSFGGTLAYASDFLGGDLLIGEVEANSGAFHFPGDIDEVKYYNHALTTDEVVATFNADKPADIAGPAIVSAARDPLDATKVIIVFSESLNAASAAAIANYQISGGITISSATLGTDQKTVTLTTSSIAAGSTATLTVNGVRDLVNNAIAANSQISIEVPLGAAPRVQDSGADGLVAIEAENYHAKVDAADGHTWTRVTSAAGFSGTGAMQALPNAGLNAQNDIATAPGLEYKVRFSKTGTHYVWLRGVADSAPGASADDSVHVGLNGELLETSRRISVFPQGAGFVWSRSRVDANVDIGPARFEIPTAGDYTINVWMREDGFLLDKIVITSNANYTPADAGPTESPQAASALASLDFDGLTAFAAPGGLVSHWRAENNTLDSVGSNHGKPFPAPGSLLSDVAIVTIQGGGGGDEIRLSNAAISAGNFQAAVSGTAGARYLIQRTTNFTEWTPVVTNTAPFTFSDAISGANAARFYRAVSAP